MKLKWVALALIALAPPVQAQITGTDHDMTSTRVQGGPRGTVADPAGSTGGVINYGEICIYCHVPHDANKNLALWNRKNLDASQNTYTMYAVPAGWTIDSKPNPASMACLSCHDATIAIEDLANVPYKRGGWGTATGGVVKTFAQIGTDLSNDHPVSVTYQPTADGFNDVSSSTNVKLYNNKVECASCHDPHNKGYSSFLRSSNTGSALCLSCHNK